MPKRRIDLEGLRIVKPLLFPPPSIEELAAELRRRIAATRKTVEQSKRHKLKVQEMVCGRTAQELTRLLFWIEGE